MFQLSYEIKCYDDNTSLSQKTETLLEYAKTSLFLVDNLETTLPRWNRVGFSGAIFALEWGRFIVSENK